MAVQEENASIGKALYELLEVFSEIGSKKRED